MLSPDVFLFMHTFFFVSVTVKDHFFTKQLLCIL